MIKSATNNLKLTTHHVCSSHRPEVFRINFVDLLFVYLLLTWILVSIAVPFNITNIFAVNKLSSQRDEFIYSDRSIHLGF